MITREEMLAAGVPDDAVEVFQGVYPDINWEGLAAVSPTGVYVMGFYMNTPRTSNSMASYNRDLSYYHPEGNPNGGQWGRMYRDMEAAIWRFVHQRPLWQEKRDV